MVPPSRAGKEGPPHRLAAMQGPPGTAWFLCRYQAGGMKGGVGGVPLWPIRYSMYFPT